MESDALYQVINMVKRIDSDVQDGEMSKHDAIVYCNGYIDAVCLYQEDVDAAFDIVAIKFGEEM